MRLAERQQELDAALLSFRDLWHPQPFRQPHPQWCESWPALVVELLALPESDVTWLNDDGGAALALLARHVPAVAALARLVELPARQGVPLPDRGAHWAWEIPGRKRQQIEAFAAAAGQGGQPVLDWCGGKGPGLPQLRICR